MRVCERYNRGCEHEEEASVEEEVVEAMDPKPEIEDSCKPRCVKQLISYEVWDLIHMSVGWKRNCPCLCACSIVIGRHQGPTSWWTNQVVVVVF